MSAVKRKFPLIPLLIAGFFLITHLYQLTLLPVFADEAIYIRWSQLIIDDWKQYLFFPLNDGKTPLQMWLMVPFLMVKQDPLFMARLLSVVVGFGQMFVIAAIIRCLGGKRTTAWLGMALTAILPFWYFHHRMALIDALLSLCLSLTVWGLLKLSKKPSVRWTILTGIFFGLSLLTKLPALLLAPTFLLCPLFLQTKTKTSLVRRLAWIGVSGFIGLLIFVSLKLHPAFSQLFGRGGDFLYPWRQVLFEGGWQMTLRSIPRYLQFIVSYLTWPVIALALFGLFSPDSKRRRVQHLLFWSAVAFAAPMVLFGKVVYPRYFLPVSIFLTVTAALSIETIVDHYVHHASKIWQQVVAGVVVALLLANTAAQSGVFIAAALTDSNQLPLVAADKEQYLHEWSSGHGITQVVAAIQAEAQQHTIAVATEGSFGTLPDGILMYLHNQDVSHIYVEGIGYPVKSLSPKFIQRARSFDTAWLVVNSHRLEFAIPKDKLLHEYCRPDGAPCLQVWDITTMVKTP